MTLLGFRRWPRAVPLAVWLATITAAGAQSVPVLVRGNLDLTALGAFKTGSSLSSESTTALGNPPQRLSSPPSNGSISLQVGWSVASRVVVSAGWGYLAGGKTIYNQVYVTTQPPLTTQSASVVARASATKVTFGLQYLMPLSRAMRIVPYAGVGGGVVRSSGDLSSSAVGGSPGESFSGPYTSYHGYQSGVAGFRYYFNERVGIKVESEVNHVADRGVYESIGLGLFARFR